MRRRDERFCIPIEEYHSGIYSTNLVYISKAPRDMRGNMTRRCRVMTRHIERRTSELEPKNGWVQISRDDQQVNMSIVQYIALRLDLLKA